MTWAHLPLIRVKISENSLNLSDHNEYFWGAGKQLWTTAPKKFERCLEHFTDVV